MRTNCTMLVLFSTTLWSEVLLTNMNGINHTEKHDKRSNFQSNYPNCLFQIITIIFLLFCFISIHILHYTEYAYPCRKLAYIWSELAVSTLLSRKNIWQIEVTDHSYESVGKKDKIIQYMLMKNFNSLIG